METSKTFQDLVWNERLWLPGNVTWRDLENHDERLYHAQAKHLYFAFIVGAILFVTRPLFERYIARNIGILFVKETKVVTAPENKVLETVYRKNRKPSYNDIQGLTKQTDLTQRQIERWFRIRRNQEKGNLMEKFTEVTWRLFIHTVLLITGVAVVWGAPWIMDSREFWRNYPHQHVSRGLYWYYMLQIGNSLSASARHCLYDKRKDFWIFLIHHTAAILLLLSSWCANFVRIGTAVLVIHDISDPFLQLMKLCIYAKKGKMVDVTVILFASSWIITRLFIFPYKCIWPTWHIGVGPFIMWGFYITLFSTLFILHCVWTTFLISGVLNRFMVRSLQDTRSSEEEEVSDGNQPELNGHIKHKEV